jgi:hypothetical protein
MAIGQLSSVSGGNDNTASGFKSSVSGGEDNTASATSSAVSGGQGNLAIHNFSSIAGGNGIMTDATWDCECNNLNPGQLHSDGDGVVDVIDLLGLLERLAAQSVSH